METTKKVFELIFPKGVFEWFDLKEGTSDENNARIVFEEKDNPPITENQKIIARKFHDITITDFPLRGKIEGQKEYLKRDIALNFPGTQLEKEFADFLKDDGGRGTILAGFYRKVSTPPDQRI